MEPEIIRNSGADMDALFDEIRDLRDRINDLCMHVTLSPNIDFYQKFKIICTYSIFNLYENEITHEHPQLRIIITWIPEHSEIEGNEHADAEAKKAAMEPTSSQPFQHRP